MRLDGAFEIAAEQSTNKQKDSPFSLVFDKEFFAALCVPLRSFKGQFEVAEQGIFVFDGGKVLIDENSSEIQRKVGKEVNKIIAGFLAHSRPSNLQYQ